MGTIDALVELDDCRIDLLGVMQEGLSLRPLPIDGKSADLHRIHSVKDGLGISLLTDDLAPDAEVILERLLGKWNSLLVEAVTILLPSLGLPLLGLQRSDRSHGCDSALSASADTLIGLGSLDGGLRQVMEMGYHRQTLGVVVVHHESSRTREPLRLLVETHVWWGPPILVDRTLERGEIFDLSIPRRRSYPVVLVDQSHVRGPARLVITRDHLLNIVNESANLLRVTSGILVVLPEKS